MRGLGHGLVAVLATAACGGATGADDAGDDVVGDDTVVEDCGSNERPVLVGQLYRPTTSHDRGFYDQPFVVTIEAEPGSDIIYTVDGSDPTDGIGVRTPAPAMVSVDTTTVLRARAFRTDAMPSHATTVTYLFPDHVLAQGADQPDYPHLVVPSYPNGASQTLDYEMDPDIVGADPAALRASLTAVPSISIVMDRDDLFGADGIYAAGGSGQNSLFERATSVELLHPTRPEYQFQIDAAIRPHTHVLVKRSFKLLFKREYGPGKLDSCLFRDAALSGESATKEFDSVILRGGTNRSLHHWCNPDDSTYVEDQWMHDSQLAASGIGAHGTYVHLYINGLYFGLYNAMERPDDSFAASYLGGDNADWFSINHGGYVDGDPARWEYLTGDLIGRDMADAANYAELEQYVDLDGFIDYLLINWFAGTTDWPENNWYAANQTNPPGPVRFFIWDADEVWDGRCQGPGDPTPGHAGAWVMPDFRAEVGGTGLAIADIWHAARRNPGFMQRFVARVDALVLGDGPLTEAQSLARWNALAARVEPAFAAETARWGDSRAEVGERTRTLDNMWRPTAERWRTERLPGNVDRLIAALRAEGYYP